MKSRSKSFTPNKHKESNYIHYKHKWPLLLRYQTCVRVREKGVQLELIRNTTYIKIKIHWQSAVLLQYSHADM